MFYISKDSIQNIKVSLLVYHLETKFKLKLTEDIELNSRKIFFGNFAFSPEYNK